MEKAAVVTLNMGLDTKGEPRSEHSVLYFGGWDALPKLLANPRRFFKDRESKFEQIGGYVSWALSPQAVVYLRPFNADLHSVVALGDAVQASFPMRFTRTDASQLEGITKAVWEHNEIREGAFLAEFIVNTSALMISYAPPLGIKEGTVAPRPRYDLDWLLTPTIAYTQSATDPNVGYLHMDLSGGPANNGGIRPRATAKDVANFAVDMLESRAAFAKHVNENPAYVGNSTLQPAGKVVYSGPSDGEPENPGSAKRKNFVPPPYDHSLGLLGFDMPNCVIDGIGPNPLTDTCYPGIFCLKDDQYELGDISFKPYN